MKAKLEDIKIYQEVTERISEIMEQLDINSMLFAAIAITHAMDNAYNIQEVHERVISLQRLLANFSIKTTS